MIDAAGESESHGVKCFLLLFALLAAHQLALNLLIPAVKQQQQLSLSQTDRQRADLPNCTHFEIKVHRYNLSH